MVRVARLRDTGVWEELDDLSFADTRIEGFCDKCVHEKGG